MVQLVPLVSCSKDLRVYVKKNHIDGLPAKKLGANVDLTKNSENCLICSNLLRHVMRAILSVRPKCSHRCVSLKKSPQKSVQILKHATKISTEQNLSENEMVLT